jgi:hypothetical protein
MNNTEIWVQVNGEWRMLDTFEDEVISLNYNLADIQDLSSRNSSFSKTIVLPDTKVNRMAFEYISELTADSLFNQNIKSPCYILCNGLLVFRGNLQLKNVKPDFQNSTRTFEIVVFSETDTFIRAIGENYINDLDFSYLNHEWTYANITNSWFQNNSLGYYYPFIDYGKNWTETSVGLITPINLNVDLTTGVYVEDMRPAFYVKTILDRIFLETGFTYKSNFLNSDYFKSLVMPHNGQNLIQGDEIYDNVFRVEYTSTPGYYEIFNPLFNSGAFRLNYSNEGIPNFDINNVYLANPTYSFEMPDDVFIQRFGCELVINFLVGATVSGPSIDQVEVNPISGIGPFLYTDTEIYLKFGRGTDNLTSFNRNIPVDGGYYSNSDPSYLGTLVAKVKWRSPLQNGVNTGYTKPEFVNAYPNSTYEFYQVGNKIYGSFSCTIITDDLDNRSNPANPAKFAIMNPNELANVWIAMRTNVPTPDWVGLTNPVPNIPGWVESTTFGIIPITNAQFPQTGGSLTINSETSFYNDISSRLPPGGIMNMNAALPRKVKQKDFVKGLINLFNLYLEPDITNSKVLYIEPRDDFYGGGETLDWSSKVDLSSINMTFISDFQSKKTTLTYKSDGDYLNKTYTDQTEEIYGERIYEFDNDFIIDENKIETAFSPTPIISLWNGAGYGTFPISRISKDVNGGVYESNIRILQKNYINLSAQSKTYWVLWQTYLEGGAAMVQSSLPWAGHLDNPFNPTSDLNYGQVYTSSFSWEPTLNTVTYRYWKNYMDLINNPNSRYLEADFLLDETDISNFTFRNKIYLDLNGQAGLYVVNKISNYNPLIRSLTRVELIKIN